VLCVRQLGDRRRAWGFLLGLTGFGRAFIPEFALLGLIYAGAAVIFDGYAVFGC